jgi:GGDEF domain-containing protein
MVQQAQQAMMKRYVFSEVARALCDELDDHNIIAHDNGHFLVLLPEVTSEELTHLVNNLREVISERVGVILQIGTASFPDDAVTFDSLVEQAMGEMEREPEPKCLSQSRQLSG